jgi:adenylate cyclase
LLFANWKIDSEANHEKARGFVEKALQLDRDLAEAHATMGLVLGNDWNIKGMEVELEKAITLKPSYASAHLWYSYLMVAELKWEDAYIHIKRAVELDPFSQITHHALAFIYSAKQDWQGAIEANKRVIELDPATFLAATAHLSSAWALGKMRNLGEARREAGLGVLQLESSYPYVGKSVEGALAYLENDKAKVRDLLPELEEHVSEITPSALDIAQFYFYLGEKDKGFEWLEKALERREDVVYAKINEFLGEVRDDPRYLSLLKRVGLG